MLCKNIPSAVRRGKGESKDAGKTASGGKQYRPVSPVSAISGNFLSRQAKFLRYCTASANTRRDLIAITFHNDADWIGGAI